MRHFSGGNVERVIVVGLDSGDDLLVSIKRVIETEGIANGVVISGVGSLSKARYHIVEPGDEKPWKDRFIEKAGTIEIESVSGIIANGEPHLHISLSQADEGFGGHLEVGSKVLTLAEIVILELSGKMQRIVGKEGFGRIHSMDV
ncbi:MAG: DNA-binding protein [Firmicutes bacterium]|jgi:predicted DNA-binding protein with PD1-like motif|nr:DNA-binding protein [Bacillota bacterium]